MVEGSPSTLPLMLKAALPVLPGRRTCVPGRAQERRHPARPDADPARRTGGPGARRGVLRGLRLHAQGDASRSPTRTCWRSGCTCTIMTDGSFPFPAIGTVHLENTITQHRPIAASEKLQVTARPDHLRPHAKGSVFDLLTTVHSGGELVWEETSTFLRIGKGDRDAAGSELDGLEQPDSTGTSWKLPGDLGRRYAAVSGRPQPDPPLRADRQGVRLPTPDRARHVEQGPLPRRARRPAARRGHGRGRVQEAGAAARHGAVRVGPPTTATRSRCRGRRTGSRTCSAGSGLRSI